eukprot:SAG11_NODE_1132_length_5752_cov_8.739685_3_plen_47_part_00
MPRWHGLARSLTEGDGVAAALRGRSIYGSLYVGLNMTLNDQSKVCV